MFFHEKYLEIIFTVDVQQQHDVKEKIVRTLTRCGTLRHILDPPDLSVIKFRLHQVTVYSILSYDCETWTLNPIIMKMINDDNSRMFVRFTDNTIPHEDRSTTCYFNLVRHIRVRRFIK